MLQDVPTAFTEGKLGKPQNRKFSQRDVKLVITILEYRGVESNFSAPSICTSDKFLRSNFLKKKDVKNRIPRILM
jgi:hypothetical protein